MTKEEVVKLFVAISAMFPRDEKFAKADQMMVDMWQKMLADIKYEHAQMAVEAAVATSPFPPSIAEIRDYATRITAPKRLSADEAWGIASECIRKYGLQTRRIAPETEVVTVVRFGDPVSINPSGREYEAKFHCPPEVWKMLKHMGYADIVKSDNPDVVRGQFLKAWGAHDTEAKEQRVLGIVPEILKAITGDTWFLLEEGEDA